MALGGASAVWLTRPEESQGGCSPAGFRSRLRSVSARLSGCPAGSLENLMDACLASQTLKPGDGGAAAFVYCGLGAPGSLETAGPPSHTITRSPTSNSWLLGTRLI